MTVGSAVGSSALTGLCGATDDLPCADFGLLALLKRSPEYDLLRRRVVNRKPVDAWQLDGEHYFVFELLPAENGAAATTATSFALFKMRWEDNGPVAALIVTPSPDGAHAEVRDARQPDSVHLVPLSRD